MKNLIIVLLLVSGFTYSQTIGNGDGIKTDAQAGTVYKEVPIEGTPFFDAVYKKGETVINGKVQRTTLMRYNALHEYVELLDENNQPRRLLRRANISATFGGKTYLVANYKFNGKIKSGYFNPLNEGNTVLFFRPKKKFVQAEKPDHGYDDFDPPTYRDVSTFYLKQGELPAQEIKLNKRNLLRALSDRADELKAFIADEKLNLKDTSDVVKLITYYNGLQAPKVEQNFNS